MFLALTVNAGVVRVTAGLVCAWLVQRAASRARNTIALRVTHIGSADAATVGAQEVVSTGAVLT